MWMQRNASRRVKLVNVSKWNKINCQDATIFNKSNEIVKSFILVESIIASDLLIHINYPYKQTINLPLIQNL